MALCFCHFWLYLLMCNHIYLYKYTVSSYIKLLCCSNFIVQNKYPQKTNNLRVFEPNKHFIKFITNIKINLFHKWNSLGLILEPNNILAHGVDNRCRTGSTDTCNVKTLVCRTQHGEEQACWGLELQRAAAKFQQDNLHNSLHLWATAKLFN